MAEVPGKKIIEAARIDPKGDSAARRVYPPKADNPRHI